MKIIYFSNDRKVLRTLEKVTNPVNFGLHEIRWQNGGDALAEDSTFYVIVEDGVVFEEITEEEFLRQYKEQAKFELAKRLEKNKLFYMVDGTTETRQSEFLTDKERIESLTSVEDIKLFMTEVKERNTSFI
jgi:hypothetical protein